MSAKPETVAEDTLNIVIDDVEYPARKGAMIIEVADANGIHVPRFCYHKKLPVAANCRMCMVQVEMGGRMAPKPLPACATPVADGMRVWTTSDYARQAQRAVMEFLLINHPLDCPICDQGGECELQDVALQYGRGVSRFSEQKRAVPEKDFGPLIASDMTRCIHCTRCVRFLQHVAGFKEMGGLGRGERVEIGTYVQHNLESELSGNIIDVCPVGALTSRPFRFRARAWEMVQTASVAPHDCIGSNLYLHTRRGQLLRAVPREHEAINEVWLSDRDRFAVDGVNAADRLHVPMVKRADGWAEVEWEEALHIVAQALGERVKAQGPDQLAMLASPSATLEELSLFARLAEGLGVSNLDHRLRRTDFTGQEDEPLYPFLGQTLEEIEHSGAILVVGGNPRKDQPILGHRIRKAAMAGRPVMYIDSVRHRLTYRPAHRVTVPPGRLVQSLAGVAAALLQTKKTRAPEALRALVESVLPTDTERAMAQTLQDAVDKRGSATLLLGLAASLHPAFSTLRALAALVAGLSGARLGFVSDGANSAGAHLAGVLPHRAAGGEARPSPGAHARQLVAEPRRNYLLFGIEPEYDCADGAQALAALGAAEFVVSCTSFVTDTMREYADVLLPINTFAETSGTFVNIEGRWQSFAAAARAPGASRPGWKVLRVLGNLLELEGFDQTSSEQLRDALADQLGEARLDNNRHGAVVEPEVVPAGSGLERVPQLPPLRVDAIVRRAAALQASPDGQVPLLSLHPADAARLSLEAGGKARVNLKTAAGEKTLELPLSLDERVAEGAAVLPLALEQTLDAGMAHAVLDIGRA
ncbi:MAG TPA: NADH-quinone oxidoreductase subunit G [Gammaproteobacteria bacterium]|nr:NADH-quinone oxidoreductase subunit G [Gammaproteobacteria bacterium]